MTDGSLVINYSNETPLQTDSKGRQVKLVQDEPPESSATVTAHDIQQMVFRAKNGRSARTYKPDGCTAKIVGTSVVVEYNFFAWAYPEDLVFTVSADIGVLSAPVLKDLDSEVSLRFERSKVAEDELPISFVKSVQWETPRYSSAGDVITVGLPTLLPPASLQVETSCFGVCRLKCKRKGLYFTLVVTLEKVEGVDDDRSKKGIAIEGLSPVVTAKWEVNGEVESTSLTLETPQCVKDLLLACWKDLDGDGIPDPPDDFGRIILNICPSWKDETPVTVYVSGCSKRVLKTVSLPDDDSSWCG